MEYKALFIWETDKGEPITNGFVKSGLDIVTHLIVPLYNKACELLNPHYETWNREFEESYPGMDGNDREYHEFIMKRSNKILEGRCEKKWYEHPVCYNRGRRLRTRRLLCWLPLQIPYQTGITKLPRVQFRAYGVSLICTCGGIGRRAGFPI